MTMLSLDIFLEGVDVPVGELSRHDDGSVSFQYLTDQISYPISQSLPIQDAIFGDAITRTFFSNLLFENAQRDQIMQRYSLDFNDITGLLYHLGSDCPGAISCVPKGHGPAKQPGNLTSDYDTLSTEDLTRLMRSLRDHRRVPDDTGDPSPLAGVQGKVALTRLKNGRFALPRAGLNVPTTHILKVPRRAEMRSVDHEHLLMQEMAHFQGHPVAETEILGEGDLKGLLITRFDRVIAGNHVSRIHQEDFCQALGLGPHLKYQRNAGGDPHFSAKAVGALLQRTNSPGRARQAFLEITLGNLLLGNTDNHAKNHALLYTGPKPQLAPVYDVVPTLIDRQVTHQLSFDIGRAQMTDDITTQDLENLIQDLGFPRMTPALRQRLTAILTHQTGRITEMRGPVRKPLGDAMAEQSKWIARALKADIDVPERDLVIINRP